MVIKNLYAIFGGLHKKACSKKLKIFKKRKENYGNC